MKHKKLAGAFAAAATALSLTACNGDRPLETWKVEAQVALSQKGYTGATFVNETPGTEKDGIHDSKVLTFNVKDSECHKKKMVVGCEQVESWGSGKDINCKVLAPI